MSARWYKRCGADFIHGTMMLTLEEKGAYSLCLDLIYDRGGPIPDDARWLSGVCGVSMRKWGAIRERLLNLGKLASTGGLLSNARADFELVSAELSSRERAETGAKGGRKRAENAGERQKNNELGQAELKPKEKRREEEKEEGDKPPPSHAREPIEILVKLIDAIVASHLKRWKNQPPPAGVSDEQWRGFIEHRRRHPKGGAFTDHAYKLLCNKLSGLGEDGWPPGEMVDLAIERGWITVFAPLDQAPRNAKPNSGPQPGLRGSRPDPSLDFLRQANADLAAERRDPEDDRGTWLALPARGTG